MKFIDKTYATPLEKILCTLVCLILVPIILMNMTMIIKRYVQPDKLPSVFWIAPVTVLSGSMEPTFGVDSLIFIKEVDPASLQEGDIICFLEEGSNAVTHRIDQVVVEDGVKSFITKGDANNTTDASPVPLETIEGKMVLIIPMVGSVILFLGTPLGMLCLVAAGLILWELPVVAQSFNRKKGKYETKK